MAGYEVGCKVGCLRLEGTEVVSKDCEYICVYICAIVRHNTFVTVCAHVSQLGRTQGSHNSGPIAPLQHRVGAAASISRASRI